MAGKRAGIDVHKKVLMVVVIDARTPEDATMPTELRRFSNWLQAQGSKKR